MTFGSWTWGAYTQGSSVGTVSLDTSCYSQSSAAAYTTGSAVWMNTNLPQDYYAPIVGGSYDNNGSFTGCDASPNPGDEISLADAGIAPTISGDSVQAGNVLGETLAQYWESGPSDIAGAGGCGDHGVMASCDIKWSTYFTLPYVPSTSATWSLSYVTIGLNGPNARAPGDGHWTNLIVTINGHQVANQTPQSNTGSGQFNCPAGCFWPGMFQPNTSASGSIPTSDLVAGQNTMTIEFLGSGGCFCVHRDAIINNIAVNGT